MRFCKECGHELRPEAKVCTNCGTKVEQIQEDPATKDQTTAAGGSAKYQKRNSNPSENNTQHGPMDPRKKRLILWISGAAALLVVGVFITYQILADIYSPDAMMENFDEAVTNEDTGAFQNVVATDISDEEAEAYFQFVDNEVGFSQFTGWVDDTTEGLNDGTSENEVTHAGFTLFNVDEDGTHFGLFDDYSISIPKYNVMAGDIGSVEKFDYDYNGETIEWSTDEDKFSELIPGNYTFSGTGFEGENEFDARMEVNFAENGGYEEVQGQFSADLFYLNFNVPVLTSWYTDADEEDITLSVDGESIEDVAVNNDNGPQTGPYSLDEDYEFTGTLDYGEESFDMDPVTLNVSRQELESGFETGVPTYTMDVNFDEEAITEHEEEIQEQERAEEERERFEEDLESNAESFVRNYLNGLESMYREEDISEVEEYVEEGSDVESALQGNMDDGTFEGMRIWSFDFDNYNRDDNTITLDVTTDRDYDSLDDSIEITTTYTLEYDPEELSFTVLGFDES